jgi:hypothetical protein
MNDKYKKIGFNLMLGALIGASCSFMRWAHSQKYENNKENYISPRDVKIKSKDIDEDGNLETILRVYDKSYLLMDKDGKLALFEYKLIPRNDTLIIGE